MIILNFIVYFYYYWFQWYLISNFVQECYTWRKHLTVYKICLDLSCSVPLVRKCLWQGNWRKGCLSEIWRLMYSYIYIINIQFVIIKNLCVTVIFLKCKLLENKCFKVHELMNVKRDGLSRVTKGEISVQGWVSGILINSYNSYINS